MATSRARQTAPGRSFVGITALGVMVVLAASTPIPWSITSRFEPLNAARNFTPTPRPAPVDLPPDPTELERMAPSWLGTLFWALVGLALAVVAGWLLGRLWRLRPRRVVQLAPEVSPLPVGSPKTDARADPEALRRGALTAWELLTEIRDPQDAVVRSWLALEQAAEASGAPRRPADSPTEFARTVLRSTAADPEAVTRLLGLYHRARFSDEPIGTAEIKQARACVSSLCRSWSGYEKALRNSVQG